MKKATGTIQTMGPNEATEAAFEHMDSVYQSGKPVRLIDRRQRLT